jgi:hypothetical protein
VLVRTVCEGASPLRRASADGGSEQGGTAASVNSNATHSIGGTDLLVLGVGATAVVCAPRVRLKTIASYSSPLCWPVLAVGWFTINNGQKLTQTLAKFLSCSMGPTKRNFSAIIGTRVARRTRMVMRVLSVVFTKTKVQIILDSREVRGCVIKTTYSRRGVR